MKYTPHHVAEAEARIDVARTRLLSTFGEIQHRLRPSTIAQDAVESAVQGVATAARKGTDAVRKRPVALAAVAGTIGLVMARGVIGSIWRGNDATEPKSDSLKPQSAAPGAATPEPARKRAAPRKRTTKGQSK
jgi:hypothetical protein